MKRIFKAMVTIILLGSICFLGGEWPEETPRNKVVTYDGGAILVALVSGLYLKRTEDKKNG